MTVRAVDLLPGDELHCYMRVGLALELNIKGNSAPIYAVPNKPQRAKSNALTRFAGWVVRNDTTNKVLTLQVSPLNSWRQPTECFSAQVDVHYSAFKKLFRLSKYAFEADSEVPGTLGGKGYRRPGSISRGTKRRAYRILEEVLL